MTVGSKIAELVIQLLPFVPKNIYNTIQISFDHLEKHKLDKQHYCLFCAKPQTKLERHLLKQHSDEPEMLPYHSAAKAKKKSELSKLRNLGNFQHNKKVLEQGSGSLVVKRKRKTGTETTKDDFVPCNRCYGFFLRKEIWRHHCLNEGVSKKGLAKKGEDANFEM